MNEIVTYAENLVRKKSQERYDTGHLDDPDSEECRREVMADVEAICSQYPDASLVDVKLALLTAYRRVTEETVRQSTRVE